MRRFPTRSRLAAAVTLVATSATMLLVAGCSSVTDSLLSAPDPDLVVPGTLASAEGAQALYFGAIARLGYATVTSEANIQEPVWLFSGLLADEWSTSSTFVQNDEVDERSIKLDNSSVRNQFRYLQRVRTSANQAIASLRQYRPLETARIGEMYMIRGFAEMQLAQDFCNGIPLSDGATETFVLGTPLPVAEVFARAIVSYDSALALTTATDTTSLKINRAARVGKARALLGINQVAAAAALVPTGTVPTAYTYDVTNSPTAGGNAIWGQGASQRRYTVGDSVEGNARNLLVANAIPFFSARDPRLPVTYTTTNAGKDTTKSQDGFTFSRTTTLWAQYSSVPLVSGLDARLVEAEAQLKAGTYVGMMTILNGLRAAPPKLGEVQPAVMAPLAIPTTAAEAEALYFREKAFWTFSRGQRLGDLRRLVRFYPGHTVANTFPTGTHYRGGDYGPDVNLPVPTDELTNPNFKGCTDRAP
jgi:hypothetical protein